MKTVSSLLTLLGLFLGTATWLEAQSKQPPCPVAFRYVNAIEYDGSDWRLGLNLTNTGSKEITGFKFRVIFLNGLGEPEHHVAKFYSSQLHWKPGKTEKGRWDDDAWVRTFTNNGDLGALRALGVLVVIEKIFFADSTSWEDTANTADCSGARVPK